MLMAGMVDLPAGPVNIKLESHADIYGFGRASVLMPLRLLLKCGLDNRVNVV